jgi:secreted trypsin-like serine protease
MTKRVPVQKISATVAKAVKEAHSAAPMDDRRFFDELKRKVEPVMPARPASNARSLGNARTSSGPRLANDPRYLANLRAVARRSANARIIGGTPSSAEFSDCVAVGDDELWGCTGTLIAPNVVLTAGHCERLHTRIFVGLDPTKKGRIFKVRTHIRHPKFDADLRNDLMILILEKKVTGVTPRKLATKALVDEASIAKVVGFGSTRLDGTGRLGTRLETDVPIVSVACRGSVGGRKDSAVYGCHLSRELVAGKPLLLHDTCKGDSGGPLFVENAAGQWLLAGTTSRGTDLAKTMCGDGGLYVRVDAYKQWISSVVKKARS